MKNIFIIAIVGVFLVFFGFSFGVYYESIKLDALRWSYFKDSTHYVDATSHYISHYDKYGVWPAPGAYSAKDFVYKSTHTHPLTNDRVDVYWSASDGGISIEFELRSNGTIRVIPYVSL